jgi:hypothetical protein
MYELNSYMKLKRNKSLESIGIVIKYILLHRHFAIRQFVGEPDEQADVKECMYVCM